MPLRTANVSGLSPTNGAEETELFVYRVTQRLSAIRGGNGEAFCVHSLTRLYGILENKGFVLDQKLFGWY